MDPGSAFAWAEVPRAAMRDPAAAAPINHQRILSFIALSSRPDSAIPMVGLASSATTCLLVLRLERLPIAVRRARSQVPRKGSDVMPIRKGRARGRADGLRADRRTAH